LLQESCGQPPNVMVELKNCVVGVKRVVVNSYLPDPCILCKIMHFHEIL
jgi:hypothetical protein